MQLTMIVTYLMMSIIATGLILRMTHKKIMSEDWNVDDAVQMLALKNMVADDVEGDSLQSQNLLYVVNIFVLFEKYSPRGLKLGISSHELLRTLLTSLSHLCFTVSIFCYLHAN